MSQRHWFIVPDLAGHSTGGTLFNRFLLEALDSASIRSRAVDLEAGKAALAAGDEGVFWVDTLHLESMPGLRAANRAGRLLGLVCHYLPSLVANGHEGALHSSEIAALAAADLFLSPSTTMRRLLESLTGEERPILLIEPACFATAPAPLPPLGMRAVMVSNLLPGKGIEAFLSALAAHVTRSDAFLLDIIGSPDIDPDYSAACRSAAMRSPLLAKSVRFLGALSPQGVVEHMAQCSLVVSASRWESYGMALAEARTLGVPILARAGGHVAEHVLESAGGELVRNEAELARAFLGLCRAPEELRSRCLRARRNALGARSWQDAARDFATQALLALSAAGPNDQ